MDKYLIANWKQNLSNDDCLKWVNDWEKFPPLSFLKVIVCPAFPLIWNFSNLKNLSCGAQDVSKHLSGSHTGEISALQFPHFVKYCIVGHSERRAALQESVASIKEKIKNLLKYDITPIFCFEDEKELLTLPDIIAKIVVVFEPAKNISVNGIYQNIDSDSLAKNFEKIKQITGENVPILYGGGVNIQNADTVKNLGFNGVLVGKSSLDPEDFYNIGKVWQEK